MITKYIFKAEDFKAALDAIEEMQDMLDKWSEQYPDYHKNIDIEEIEDDEYPYMVTLSITDEDTET